MSFEIVKLQNAPSERVIDACVELLDAGRPLSEVMREIKRLSKEDPSRIGPDLREAEAAEQVTSAAEKRTRREPAFAQAASETTHANRKPHRLWLIAALMLLAGATAIAGNAYLPRAMMPSASTVTPATAPSTALLPILSSSDVGRAHDPEQAALMTTQTKALVERGTTLVGSGELAAARLYYEPAVKAGDAQAAIYLGETYDPHFLKRARFGKSVRGDLKMAEYWFRRAQQLGSGEAEARLTDLHRK
jgi:hypothetical protein